MFEAPAIVRTCLSFMTKATAIRIKGTSRLPDSKMASRCLEGFRKCLLAFGELWLKITTQRPVTVITVTVNSRCSGVAKSTFECAATVVATRTIKRKCSSYSESSSPLNRLGCWME